MGTSNQPHIVWHEASVSKEERQKRNRLKSCVVWFTGLSGSGKSTLANALDRKLFEEGIHSYVLDGDNIRHGLNAGLGFSEEDRKENIRRIGEVAKLFVDAGVVTSTAFISPFREDRDNVRGILDDGEFIEVYVRCPLETCEKRDPKGLYKKARSGDIPEFTGISSPYEEPVNPELIIDTDQLAVEEAVEKIYAYLHAQESGK
ncbi:adenylyl-sulfate kinase [Halalkalibacterium halodurans]|uniref:Probable adenylyl-sulfate kinase n=2 Tax=Halalkalibacterium halodurans TaxID=86665 RepID=CYSC1_HALH5|nr:adenylyl-sulfate kinase [Halalkalibacterium halodurans]Q9KCT0.1 RecName: Full=Probable adenylyl-sulfate kinase; AltName: Full=APS kinase; AltName: Full=ATP adenosine-5'-phosphosulfate 3'-phosphotransferase; AltName: Full=Adenosine-5'-phosphosulfate kinase [Halalkalibacterium halodurans C-125]MED4082900.1 adenylyl-sulfate kinase [Halalkalibacterium halodurans]MED4084786.1 adenylyl-sulfate kinase [Halalkalibacterium halodurans]MED4106106.1 adenylyl-sulfate kinase [Halalkalibacterium halodurans